MMGNETAPAPASKVVSHNPKNANNAMKRIRPPMKSVRRRQAPLCYFP